MSKNKSADKLPRFKNRNSDPFKSYSDESARRAKGENPFIILVALIIAAIVGASLWISSSALMEKMRLYHGLQQINDISTDAHEAIASHRLDKNNQEDLIAILEHLGYFISKGEFNGLRALNNPWNGTLVAVTIPGGHARIETMVPQKTCRRVIDLFKQNVKLLEIERIEIRNRAQSWQPIYVLGDPHQGSDVEISAACSMGMQTDILFTISIH